MKFKKSSVTLSLISKTHTDKENKEGMYMLAGSHNFINGKCESIISWTYTAVLSLLLFSHYEMEKGEILPSSVNEEVFMEALSTYL